MSNFDVKKKIDDRIYRLFNRYSDIKFSLNFGLRRELSRNAACKEMYMGERCFIVGTGPSLRNLSGKVISALADEYIFAVNSFYKIDFLDGINPDFYLLLDNNYWGVAGYTYSDLLEKYGEALPLIITDIRARSFTEGVPLDRKMFLYTKNYPVDRVRFSLDGNMSATMNVVSTAILSAIYMGFKEIYLLGCDYNLFCSRVGTHSYDDSGEIEELPKYNLAFYLKYYHITTEIHYLISELAERRGVKLRNATDGSLLDAYRFSHINDVLEID